MPIIFKNQIVTSNSVEPPKVEVKIIPQPTQQIVPQREEVVAVTDTSLPTTESPDHHVLVVDGKAKLISKRSQYLLDMMTKEV
jgi:hypothetical protein